MSSAPGLLALLAERDVHLSLADDGRLNIDMPTAAPLDAEELALLREHRAEIIAGLLAEPTAHCDRCGSPSFWRSPASPGWRCSWCEPRPVPLPEGFEALTLPGGQWAPGTAPPVPEQTTADDLLATHGPLLLDGTVRTADVLAEADDGDLPELRDRAALEGFARALVADHRVLALPDPGLPPLARLAAEIGDDPAELRAWLDQSAQGRRIRARTEREAGACDRALLALRADPAGGLHAVLLDALEGSLRTRV